MRNISEVTGLEQPRISRPSCSALNLFLRAFSVITSTMGSHGTFRQKWIYSKRNFLATTSRKIWLDTFIYDTPKRAFTRFFLQLLDTPGRVRLSRRVSAEVVGTQKGVKCKWQL